MSLPTAPLTAALIVAPSPPSPWSIDPGRTQELPPSGWATRTLTAVLIVAPSPWSIDPNRTQELPP